MANMLSMLVQATLSGKHVVTPIFFCILFPTVSVEVGMIFLCPASFFFSSFLPPHAVQLTVPIGDDGQLMSGRSWGPPVLWISKHAVQLTVPTGDDGQLMSGGSCGPPVL